jgi:hypothetical protein
MHKPEGISRFYSILTACLIAGLACKYSGGTETPIVSTGTATSPVATDAPTESLPAETATTTATEPAPTATVSPVPPSPTPTPIPPTDTLDISGWFNVIGTWSGCAEDPEPGVPYSVVPCSAPSGGFVTLWIKPTCTVGQYCGNYVRAMFESEFIRLKLTLLGIQGPVVRMRGESSSPTYSSSNTDVAIERVGGNRVRIAEKAGNQYIFVLPRGCDQIIQANTTIGCFEYLL